MELQFWINILILVAGVLFVVAFSAISVNIYKKIHVARYKRKIKNAPRGVHYRKIEKGWLD